MKTYRFGMLAFTLAVGAALDDEGASVRCNLHARPAPVVGIRLPDDEATLFEAGQDPGCVGTVPKQRLADLGLRLSVASQESRQYQPHLGRDSGLGSINDFEEQNSIDTSRSLDEVGGSIVRPALTDDPSARSVRL